MGTLLVDTIQSTSGGPFLGWTLLSTTVASGDATIDITDLTDEYAMYKFVWTGLAPATESTTKFFMRTDSDNGASFDAGASDYAWSNHRVSMLVSTPAHDPEGDDSDSEMQINGNDALGTNANELMDVEITCFNPSGTEYTKFKWEGMYFDAGATPLGNHIIGAGIRLSAALVDAVQFLYSTGNIEVGTLKVYGVRK